MKIGIMTFWWSDDNYGQILQCYALQKYLRDAGHDAYLIRYDPRKDYIKTPLWKNVLKAFNPVLLIRFIYFKIKNFNDQKEKKEYPRHFDEFRNNYINQSERTYYSYIELAKSPPEADVYIVGSDQIWNPDLLAWKKTTSKVRIYFLDFGGSDMKRISYAASFGKDDLEEDFIKIIKPLLHRFDFIGVREKSGITVCRNCGVEKAEWTPDPTMLLDKEIYRSLYSNKVRNYSEKPYCLVYLLGNKYDYPIKSIYDWAEKKKLNIIYITGNKQHDKYKKTYATIPEWIYLIDHAEYMITNSYHCSVFSLLFQKSFGVISLTGIDAGMNDRFLSIFEQFDIEQRFINNDMTVLDKNINWDNINNTFSRLRTKNTLLNIIQKDA